MKIFFIIIVSMLILSESANAQIGKWKKIDDIKRLDSIWMMYVSISCPDSLNCITNSVSWAFGGGHEGCEAIRKTTDGGLSWNEIIGERGHAVYDKDSVWLYWKFPPVINDLDCPNNELCIAVHDSGYISRSTDGGFSWKKNIVAESAFGVVKMFNELKGIAHGSKPGTYLTNDGGHTWNKIIFPDSINTSRIGFPEYTDSNTIIMLAYPKDVGAFIIRTTDGGLIWAHGEPRTGEPLFRDMKFIDSFNGWAVAARWAGDISGTSIYNDCVYHTTDGGFIWDLLLDSMTYSRGLDFIDAYDNNYIMAAGKYGQVWMTNDGGKNWKLNTNIFDMNKYGGISAITFITKNSAIALNAWDDELYRYSESIISVEDFQNPLSEDALLSPNPCSEKLLIQMKSSLVSTIHFYSSSGILLNEYETKGQNNIELDLSDYANGLYFLEINKEFHKVVVWK